MSAVGTPFNDVARDACRQLGLNESLYVVESPKYGSQLPPVISDGASECVLVLRPSTAEFRTPTGKAAETNPKSYFTSERHRTSSPHYRMYHVFRHTPGKLGGSHPREFEIDGDFIRNLPLDKVKRTGDDIRKVGNGFLYLYDELALTTSR